MSLSYPRTAVDAARCIADLDRAVAAFTSPPDERALFEAQRLLATCGFPGGSQAAEDAFNVMTAAQHALVADLARAVWKAQATALLSAKSDISPGHVVWVMALGAAHWEVDHPWDPVAAKAQTITNTPPTNQELENYGTMGAIWKLGAMLQCDMTPYLPPNRVPVGTSRDEVVYGPNGTTVIHYLGSGSSTPNVVHFDKNTDFVLVLESKANTSAYKDRNVVTRHGQRTGNGRVMQNDPKIVPTLAACLLHNKSRDTVRKVVKQGIGGRLWSACEEARVGYLCIRSYTDRAAPPMLEHRLFVKGVP